MHFCDHTVFTGSFYGLYTNHFFDICFLTPCSHLVHRVLWMLRQLELGIVVIGRVPFRGGALNTTSVLILEILLFTSETLDVESLTVKHEASRPSSFPPPDFPLAPVSLLHFFGATLLSTYVFLTVSISRTLTAGLSSNSG